MYTGDVETEGEAHSSDDEETDPGSDWSEPSIPEPLEEKLKRYISCFRNQTIIVGAIFMILKVKVLPQIAS